MPERLPLLLLRIHVSFTSHWPRIHISLATRSGPIGHAFMSRLPSVNPLLMHVYSLVITCSSTGPNACETRRERVWNVNILFVSDLYCTYTHLHVSVGKDYYSHVCHWHMVPSIAWPLIKLAPMLRRFVTQFSRKSCYCKFETLDPVNNPVQKL